MKDLKFRTPVKCQNGHKAFWYWRPKQEGILHAETIRHPDECGCHSFVVNGIHIPVLGGWSRDGDDQMFIGEIDFIGIDIYSGDILDTNLEKYPEDSSPYVVVFESGAFRSLRKDWPKTIQKPIVEREEIFTLEDRIIGSTHLTPELLP